MKQKTISLLLALALALSLAGCKKEETVTAPAGVAVQVQTVEAQDIASENTVSGQVTAGSETSVYVTATAKCTAVYVEAGDAVKAGDVIEVKESSRSSVKFKRLTGEDAPTVLVPKWLERDKNALKGTVVQMPAREDIDLPVEEHLIVELYSK